MGEFTYFGQEQPLWLVGAALFLAQVLVREAGGWTRRRMAGATDGQADDTSDTAFILSGVLGLLALMIAFTFSLAMNRYETRRDLVVAEANAIGTAEMRVQLLASGRGTELKHLLHTYSRTRLKFGEASAVDKAGLAATSTAQRTSLQAATIAALATGPDTPIGALVVTSINEVLDVGVQREAMLAERVPATVLVALAAFTLLSATILGFSLTGSNARQRPLTTILFALLTLSIVLILDLDRPQSGTIHTDQTPILRLVAGFVGSRTAAPQDPAK